MLSLNNIDGWALLATFPLKNTIALVDTLKTAAHVYFLLFRQLETYSLFAISKNITVLKQYFVLSTDIHQLYFILLAAVKKLPFHNKILVYFSKGIYGSVLHGEQIVLFQCWKFQRFAFFMQISPKCWVDNWRLFYFVLAHCLSFTLKTWATALKGGCFVAGKKTDAALISLLTVLMLIEFIVSCAK